MDMTEPNRRLAACDVVVVGSGAAALAAAIVAHDRGAQVLVVEKSDEIGGTSAVSGGVLWMPGNHHAFAAPVARAASASRRACSPKSSSRPR